MTGHVLFPYYLPQDVISVMVNPDEEWTQMVKECRKGVTEDHVEFIRDVVISKVKGIRAAGVASGAENS